jgi:hypothetical protein
MAAFSLGHDITSISKDRLAMLEASHKIVKNKNNAEKVEAAKKHAAALEELAKLKKEKEATNTAAKEKKEAANAEVKKQKEDANLAKKQKSDSLKMNVYKNGDIVYRPRPDNTKLPLPPKSAVFNKAFVVVDGEYFCTITSDPCQYCNALLLLPNETIANHKKECIRYNQELYDAYIDLIRKQGDHIKNTISGLNNANLTQSIAAIVAARETYNKLLEEYKKDPKLTAAAADKPDFIVGPYDSKPDGYKRVTKDDISKRFFATKLDKSHGNGQDGGLDIVPSEGMDITDALHIEEGKLLIKTGFTYSEISCLDENGDPKKPGIALKKATVYHFHLKDGSKYYNPVYSVKESTVTPELAKTTPCLFIGENVNITTLAKAKLQAKLGGKQKHNKTHRKYYARRNKKHTRRH